MGAALYFDCQQSARFWWIPARSANQRNWYPQQCQPSQFLGKIERRLGEVEGHLKGMYKALVMLIFFGGAIVAHLWLG